MKVLSPHYRLTKEDIKRVLRNILLMYGPVMLLFLDQIQAGTVDYKILLAAGLGITLDTVRRLIREVTTK